MLSLNQEKTNISKIYWADRQEPGHGASHTRVPDAFCRFHVLRPLRLHRPVPHPMDHLQKQQSGGGEQADLLPDEYAGELRGEIGIEVYQKG